MKMFTGYRYSLIDTKTAYIYYMIQRSNTLSEENVHDKDYI